MLTQEQYTLYTGLTVNYSEEDWRSIVSVAEVRLASFLCLEELPGTEEDGELILPDDFALLLANFIAGVLKFRGDGGSVSSKRVRNFTINFKTSSATDAFSQIATQYGDIIDKYSQCGIGVKVEWSGCHRCYYNGRF
jgi:hypothetical protein